MSRPLGVRTNFRIICQEVQLIKIDFIVCVWFNWIELKFETYIHTLSFCMNYKCKFVMLFLFLSNMLKKVTLRIFTLFVSHFVSNFITVGLREVHQNDPIIVSVLPFDVRNLKNEINYTSLSRNRTHIRYLTQ